MLDNVLRATCDRCSATVEVVGEHDLRPSEFELVRANVGWTVFEMKFCTEGSRTTSEIQAALCPDCVVKFNEFLASGRDE